MLDLKMNMTMDDLDKEKEQSDKHRYECQEQLEFEEKLLLYQSILELEDWLEIKHNTQILKWCWDPMNDYYNDLQTKRYEIVYSDYQIDDNEEPGDVDGANEEKGIENTNKELDSIFEKVSKKSQIATETPITPSKELDEEWFNKLDLFRKIEEMEKALGYECDQELIELSYDDLWQYYIELHDKPRAMQEQDISDDKKVRYIVVSNSQSNFDYSGDDSSLDPNMW